ncbi:HlyU family transcriptional regulator [Lichenihabitans sp. Uapishka_5]|uniref:HlyU family transcriptional regulator n=1 Tax=Lichenihabitans sp. Uapishka_5 TaxID=3037302 RepID=UPI0029E7F7B4|nr:HlyU family transcriptional regulator [Lichenihabitans sp. Uapishka_5]MDX7949788.1 HlyU family transcriptional regulator [Lichenihabitans sp. Uapishka_5]
MSFLKKLFGAGTGAAPAEVATVTGETEHKGFTIKAVPFKENGQFQTAGLIEKLVDGTLRSHRFIRADRSPSVEEVTSLALQKGQLMVDQMGESLFQG